MFHILFQNETCMATKNIHEMYTEKEMVAEDPINRELNYQLIIRKQFTN